MKPKKYDTDTGPDLPYRGSHPSLSSQYDSTVMFRGVPGDALNWAHLIAVRGFPLGQLYA